jgi:TetR/AcrR family transcriptional regulator, cholesterol catabolism regulator
VGEAETRERLLEVAVDLFAAKGFAGTSIRDIAKAMGMSISNIYHYFGNKEGVLLELFKYSSERLLNALKAAAALEMEPLAHFKSLVSTHIEMAGRLRNHAKIYTIDEEQMSPEAYEISRGIQRQILEIYNEELRRLRAAGHLRTPEVSVLAFNILGVINWMLRWYREGGPLSLEEVRQEIVSFILHGALKHSAGPEGGQGALGA